MRRFQSAACFLALLAAATTAPAQDSEWRSGGRALIVTGSTTSGEIGDTGARFELGTGVGLEYDAVYLFSRTIAAEFSIGAAVQKLEVVDHGTCCDGGDSERLWTFPLTALVQYHIPVYGKWDPYVGVGISWTIPYYSLSDDLEASGVEKIDFESDPGVAAQIGVNYAVNNHWYANFDLRYLGVTLEARVRTGDGDLEPVTLNTKPLVIGIGFGRRF